MKKYFQINSLTITLFTLTLSVFTYLYGIPLLDRLELESIDLRFHSRGKQSPAPEIVLAAVDEKSIAQEGKWVWPRSKFASLITKLSEAGAKVIAFDIGFLEPDKTATQIMAALEQVKKRVESPKNKNLPLTVYLDQLSAESDYDTLLADALRSAKAEIILGYFFHMTPDTTDHMTGKALEEIRKTIADSEYRIKSYADRSQGGAYLIRAWKPQPNLPVISDAVRHSGHFNMAPDPDGVVREIPLVVEFKDSLYAPLSLVTASVYRNQPLSIRIDDYGVQSLRIGEQEIPVDSAGKMVINYQGPEKTFPHIPVTDILNDRVDPDVFRDKIVMVGVTAIGIYDMRVTPFDTIFPGLEIHANALDNILSHRFLTRPYWGVFADILAIILSATLIGAALAYCRLLTATLTFFMLFAGYILFTRYLFSAQGLILSMVYPLLALTITYTGITVQQARQKKFIKTAFGHYLSPAVVKQLIESPESLKLGGETRNITAFFSDVQGFTSISENLNPEELVELLNEFLTEMTEIILRHEGTVDKFEGDAIIAFFGAPNHIENHAKVACMAGIEMQKRLAELRETWREQGKPELKMRIGMCTGNAVVGNMGSKNRMDYTMMGDTVNTAARLEGLNKLYGVYTLISESTKREMGDTIVTRELDRLNVVGKTRPVTVFEVIGYHEDTDATMQAMLKHYADGLAAFRAMKWGPAMRHFEAALALFPDDGPAQTLLDRCRAFKISPPALNWDGVYTAASK
ncbi:adenylate/guanylate cyclase domain-containing pr otein [Desulfonema ishimotonii]|uniref:Adenylate/guanylate cyclase domain-containing pr otein n=1 Tax=Desulfonema ishimotonii TaxID=45657 RepID=A0A401FVG3_9BACT|nr:adenylate/guanylate cyclase domain-containing protein [Desulfonema ishimotonii]GBC60951.1 adenylate/guanylate cyclase domain-containing pr otein [Desulfonema ishimotonii]